MKEMPRSRVRQLGQKYLGHASKALFMDGAAFKEQGWEREYQLAKEIHDLSYKLGKALEERSGK